MRRKYRKFIISTIVIFVICIFTSYIRVYGKEECPYECIPASDCIGECHSEFGCTPGSLGGCCCFNPKENVSIFSEGAEWLFGEEGLTLNILKPSTLMKMEGTASFWSLVAYISSVLWWFVLVAFFFAVGIGAIRWISSQGQEAGLQSAKKWMVNAVVGFSATIVVFLIASFITWLIGIGGVFDLPQNLAVCGIGDNKQVLFEWKKEHDMLDATECTCDGNNWSCTK